MVRGQGSFAVIILALAACLLAALACGACAKKPQQTVNQALAEKSAGGSIKQPQEESGMPQATNKRVTESSMEDSQSAAGVAELGIDIANGSVECSAAEMPAGAVQVDWRITEAKGPGQKAKPEELQIELKQDGGTLVVKDNYTGPKLARRPELKLWLTVNNSVMVSLKAGNGSASLKIPRIAGVNLGNGSLQLDGELVQNAGFDIGNGSIEGQLTIASGEHTVSLGNGRIHLSLLPGSSCAVTATTGVGNIDVSGFTTQRNWHLTGGSVTGTVGAGAARLSFDVGNGQIKIDAPAANAANTAQ